MALLGRVVGWLVGLVRFWVREWKCIDGTHVVRERAAGEAGRSGCSWLCFAFFCFTLLFFALLRFFCWQAAVCPRLSERKRGENERKREEGKVEWVRTKRDKGQMKEALSVDAGELLFVGKGN